MATFYAARSEIITPLPWPTFALPFSLCMLTSAHVRFRRWFSLAIAFISQMRRASIPPYLARNFYSVALLMPCSRHSSAADKPPSICRSTTMIWASVKRLLFIRLSSFILPKEFYFRIPLRLGGLPQDMRALGPEWPVIKAYGADAAWAFLATFSGR